MGNKTKSLTINFDRKTIAKIIGGVAALLCFIGMFGTLMNEYAKGKGAQEFIRAFDLSFIFKDGWDSYNVTFLGPCEFSRFALTLSIISFFIGVLGITFAVGKSIYSIYKKKEINLKFDLAIALTSAAQYAFISRFALGYNGLANSGSSVSNTIYLMGWGVILITIGFFIGLISLFIYDFDSKYDVINKKSICTRIAAFIVFFVGLYGLTNMVSLTYTATGGDLTSISNYNTFAWLSYVNSIGSIAKNYGTAKALTIISIIFGIVSFVSLITASFFYIKGSETKIDTKLTKISTLGFVVCSLVSNVLIIVSAHLFVDTEGTPGVFGFNPGFTAIVSLILGIGLIILVSIGLKERKFSKVK